MSGQECGVDKLKDYLLITIKPHSLPQPLIRTKIRYRHTPITMPTISWIPMTTIFTMRLWETVPRISSRKTRSTGFFRLPKTNTHSALKLLRSVAGMTPTAQSQITNDYPQQQTQDFLTTFPGILEFQQPQSHQVGVYSTHQSEASHMNEAFKSSQTAYSEPRGGFEFGTSIVQATDVAPTPLAKTYGHPPSKHRPGYCQIDGGLSLDMPAALDEHRKPVIDGFQCAECHKRFARKCDLKYFHPAIRLPCADMK